MLTTVVVASDFEKAFDLLDRGAFCSAAEGIVRFLRGMYRDSAVVWFAGGQTNRFGLCTGVRRGSILSHVVLAVDEPGAGVVAGRVDSGVSFGKG